MPTRDASWGVSPCASCLQPLPPGTLRCPECGFINDRPAPPPARVKRWRILGHTYFVHPGSCPGYVTIDGHYLNAGLRVTASKGLWVATIVMGLIVILVLLVTAVGLWTLSRNPWILFCAFGLVPLLLFQVYFVLGSLDPDLPPR